MCLKDVEKLRAHTCENLQKFVHVCIVCIPPKIYARIRVRTITKIIYTYKA